LKKFSELSLEKQEVILNAAMDEFAGNGFEKASTNSIVLRARISKGSLFNYFKSKKELYLFLIEHTAGIMERVYEAIDWKQTDLFLRLREVGLIKLRIMRECPQVFDFLHNVTKETSPLVRSEIDRILQNLIKDGFSRLYENINFDLFRNDLDTNRLINIINWSMIGLSEQQKQKLHSITDINEELHAEWDSYFSIMRRCFYRQENAKDN